MAVFFLLIWFGAPWKIWMTWPLIGAAGVAILWLLPLTYLRLDDTRLSVKAPSFRGSWALDEIETVEIASWEDEPDTCRLHFGMGRTELLPDEALPNGDELASELMARQVSVKRL